MRTLAIVALAACLAALAACAHRPGPYTPLSEARRDPARAHELTREAAAALDRALAHPDDRARDLARAEDLLRRALTADLYHGPAHNNLGVVFLERGLLYEAAGEFEWARTLLPGHPDPRLNLGLAFERAGRVDDALGHYREALEVYPGHLPAIMALTRAELRHGRSAPDTDQRLREIALRGGPAWSAWARERLMMERR